MELNDAFVKAIRAYYKGDGLKEINKTIAEDDTDRTGVTYTPEYFDEMASMAKNDDLPEEDVDARSVDELTDSGS
jgi:hypothetical protein